MHYGWVSTTDPSRYKCRVVHGKPVSNPARSPYFSLGSHHGALVLRR